MSQMKCSISMSSLESPSKFMRTPDGSKKAWNSTRPCNSLSSKKPRRSLETKMRRRSWESAEEITPEELWKACLQSVQGLTDVNTDEREFLPVKEFLEDYARIREWLNSVQVERGRFADSLKLSELGQELRQRIHLRVEMVEKAKLLVRKFPKMKEEFHWRVKHMNSQWDALDKILLCQNSMNNTSYHVPIGNAPEECDIKWVREWLRKMENELQPLAFNVHWTPIKLEHELKRHKALQTEIEAKSPAVHCALRQCQSQGREFDDEIRPPRKKRGDILEKRWIQLRLRVLEWVEHLSTIQKSEEHRNKEGRKANTSICPIPIRWAAEDLDENQEPLNKYPRLCDDSAISPKVSQSGETYTSHLYLNVDLANNQRRFNESDWAMGQSHDSEDVYQSVADTGLEFRCYETFAGMKRKLTSPQSPPGEGLSPTNISTYYFKHSDTEPEPPRIHHSTPLVHQSHEIQTHHLQINNVSSSSIGPGMKSCQKSLDFSQTSSHSTQESRQSFNLKRMNQFTQSEGDEDSLEFGIDLFLQDMEADDAAYADLQNLNEIEELVQKAELLVKCNGNPTSVSGGNKSSHRALTNEWVEEGGFLHTRTSFANTSTSSYSGRKCSQLNAIVASSTTTSSPLVAGNKKLRKTSRCGNLNTISTAEGNLFLEEQRSAGRKSRPEGESVYPMEGNSNQGKIPKKNARVRQWVRAHNHNSELVGAAAATDHKNTSSCDASAESATESESEISHSEQHLSSDEPTTLSTSTAFLLDANKKSSLRKGASTASINQRSPAASTSGAGAPGIVWRKKRNCYVKQRPKSFTDTFGSQCVSNFEPSSATYVPRKQKSRFVSDSALHCIGNRSGNSVSSSSGSSPAEHSQSHTDSAKKKTFKRKLLKQKKRSLDFLEDEGDGMRLTSFCGEEHESMADHADLENKSPQLHTTKPLFFRLNSDHNSVNTDEILQSNDQDWDSYQEKYLSEPYSEEPYDQEGTLKLLAFGEDYDKVLDMADSESSSMLSGFEPNARKRRPLTLANRGEVPESDSDREEFNHFLSQSISQLHLIDVIFRKQLAGSTDLATECPTEFAEMEATCEENINSLKLILESIDKPDSLSFQIDVKTIQGVLEKWHILKEKILQAAKVQHIHDEIDILRKEFDTVTSNLEEVDPFDSRDLNSLHYKIEIIQGMLNDLSERKKRLQLLNEASLGTQMFLKESGVISDVKKHLQELYSLYEENYQLGSYLLGKMKYLQEAWESFESEKNEFEKYVSSGSSRTKLRKELSSAASTDSGHGTDFSHDSSISDSDMDFQERKQKLVALKKRASDLRDFLPPGSPVLDVIEMKIDEAERDFENSRKAANFDPLDLKIIYPKGKPLRKMSYKSPRLATIRGSSVSPVRKLKSQSSAPPLRKKEPNRNWRIIRLSFTFHLALMGLFAVAWFLQPRCCENANTFCFSLVPHLTHEKIPHI